MKFQAAQRSVFGNNMIDSTERESVETEIIHAKRLVWHGKGNNAVQRIKHWTLSCRRGRDTNSTHLVEAERDLQVPEEKCVPVGQLRCSASQGPAFQQKHRGVRVNHVVSHRMAMKQQMRWTDEGAHCMAQVRLAVLNQEFSPHRVSELKIAASLHAKCIWAASSSRHRPTSRAG